MVIESAIGGDNVTTTIEGKERYPVSVRYPRELRDDIDEMKRILVPTTSGAQVPLGEVADLKFSTGPPMITTKADPGSAMSSWTSPARATAIMSWGPGAGP